VPLLRAGFNPSGAYTVSFVYLSSGARFVKSGAYEMALPKLDVPVNVLTWEISLPERLELKQFGGNAMAAELFPAAAQSALVNNGDDFTNDESGVWTQTGIDIGRLEAGQIGGIVADANGAVIPNAAVPVTNTQTGTTLNTKSDGDGRWVISGLQPGPVRVSTAVVGFQTVQQELELVSSRPSRLGTTLSPASTSETVTVTSQSLDRLNRVEQSVRQAQAAQMNAPSQNVFNLQRRVAGVLPVRVDVPRGGKSYRFVRPLVLQEETKVTFQYKSK